MNTINVERTDEGLIVEGKIIRINDEDQDKLIDILSDLGLDVHILN